MRVVVNLVLGTLTPFGLAHAAALVLDVQRVCSPIMTLTKRVVDANGLTSYWQYLCLEIHGDDESIRHRCGAYLEPRPEVGAHSFQQRPT